MKRCLLITILSTYYTALFAQEPPRSTIDITRFIEQTFPIQGGEIPEELYENLLLYYSHPLDINKAGEADLRSLLVLTEQQIRSLLAYREANGELISLYELQAIPHFDLLTIRHLLPFITIHTTVKASSLLRRIWNEENNYLLLRYSRVLEDKRGYLNDQYTGSADKLYTRLRVHHSNDFSIGFTAEKDAGEAMVWNPQNNQYGADFYSGHIHIQNQGRLSDILLGDYQLQFGQGLVYGAGFNIGKSAETITTTRRANLGLRPYTSALETNFFRGMAATLAISDRLSITTIYSRLRQDASIKVDSTAADPFFSSIIQSGFHRTETELRNRNTLNETNLGATALYTTSRLTVGANVLHTRFDLPVSSNLKISDIHRFSGSTNQVISVFGDWGWQNVNVFGEVGRSASGGVGAITGLVAAMGSRFETSLVYRNYARDFHSSYSQAFGESTVNSNETGWYWGMKYRHSRQWLFTAYYDTFRFPWPTSRINAPSYGYEYLTRVSYAPTKSNLYYLQIRRQSKADNPSYDEQQLPIKVPQAGIQTNYLINADYDANERLSFQTRVQWSDYQYLGSTTSGFAAWHDIHLDLGKFRMSTRYALFDTDNFNNAQYAYERDVLYAFAIPAYSGRGTRQYVLLQYKPVKKLTLWAKLGRTRYTDRETIGTGNDTIEGHTRTDFQCQMRIVF